MINIILLGAPGTGKGTQGEILAKKYPFIRVIAGEILREEKDSGSELGIKIASIIDKGNLVSDDLITEMIKKYLDNLIIPEGHGLIFDGYPRTIEQAKSLEKMVNVDRVLYFDIPQNILTKRLLERGKVSGRPDDQNLEIITQRFENYEKVTRPVSEFFYSQKGLLTVFMDKNGNKSIEDISEEIEKYLTMKFNI